MLEKHQKLYRLIGELIRQEGIDKTIQVIEEAKYKGANGLLDLTHKMNHLQEVICKTYGINENQLFHQNNREITEARKITYAVMIHEFGMKYDVIGHFFNKDTSTVCRAVASFKKLLEENEEFKTVYEEVLVKLARKTKSGT